MKRRKFIALIGGVAAAWAVAARAQQSGRVRQIAVWMARANDAEGLRHAAAFREALQALGWIDGRNIRTDYRWVTGDIDRRRLAKEVVEQKPDLIVAESTVAVAVLSRERSPIPIIFVNVSDPVGSGFVASLAKPGGTITGFMSNEPTLGGKWPELLKEIAPAVKRVGLLFNPDTAPYAEPFLHSAQAAAASFGIDLKAARFHEDTEIERAIAALGSGPGGGLIVLPETTTNIRSGFIIGLAARHRVPAIYAFRYQAAAGGLISYGVDVADLFRDAASYADRILRGEKPGDLPAQAPTKFTLVVNLKTAKALGLTVPTSTLLRANEVIE
ncbi:MAG: ABC transporter substrate-binding protein [Deltaproteobacteria bacterium]|nr:ABC transporter substrate-binding protein [Deltaproteobacteria bacterium]